MPAVLIAGNDTQRCSSTSRAGSCTSSVDVLGDAEWATRSPAVSLVLEVERHVHALGSGNEQIRCAIVTVYAAIHCGCGTGLNLCVDVVPLIACSNFLAHNKVRCIRTEGHSWTHGGIVKRARNAT